MYCPKCAAQNLDDAKFCRACGANLETVALALSGHYDDVVRNKPGDLSPAETWLKKRTESARSLVQAGGLLGSSLIIGTALGLFSNTNDWIMIWMVFAGWLAVWGMFSLVAGINGLIESRLIRRQMNQPTGAPVPMLGADEHSLVTGGLASPHKTPRTSVTEHTTKQLTRPK